MFFRISEIVIRSMNRRCRHSSCKKLENGLSVKTVKDILIVLKMVMKFGVKNEWMTYYEWDIKYPTTSTNKELEVLSVANHRKILNYIQSHFTFTGLGIYISLSTGLRIGEICALKWSDINVTEGTITVSRTIERIYIIEGEKAYGAGYQHAQNKKLLP